MLLQYLFSASKSGNISGSNSTTDSPLTSTPDNTKGRSSEFSNALKSSLDGNNKNIIKQYNRANTSSHTSGNEQNLIGSKIAPYVNQLTRKNAQQLIRSVQSGDLKAINAQLTEVARSLEINVDSLRAALDESLTAGGKSLPEISNSSLPLNNKALENQLSEQLASLTAQSKADYSNTLADYENVTTLESEGNSQQNIAQQLPSAESNGDHVNTTIETLSQAETIQMESANYAKNDDLSNNNELLSQSMDSQVANSTPAEGEDALIKDNELNGQETQNPVGSIADAAIVNNATGNGVTGVRLDSTLNKGAVVDAVTTKVSTGAELKQRVEGNSLKGELNSVNQNPGTLFDGQKTSDKGSEAALKGQVPESFTRFIDKTPSAIKLDNVGKGNQQHSTGTTASESGVLKMDSLISKDSDFRFDKLLRTSDALLAQNKVSLTGQASVQATQPLNQAAVLSPTYQPTSGSVDSAIKSVTTASLSARDSALLVNVPKPQWNQRFAERISMLALKGASLARIRLDPPELGPMSVRIHTQGGETNIQFTVNNPVARDLVDSGSQRLREMLEEHGFNSVNVGVNEFKNHQDGSSHDPELDDADIDFLNRQDNELDAEISPIATYQDSIGLIDIFA